ncbi:MAG: hypothetical protein OHK0052_15350 [Anaerolineales bacterium]
MVEGENQPGAILNTMQRPEVGEEVELGDGWFEVIDVVDLGEDRGRFVHVQARCVPIDKR